MEDREQQREVEAIYDALDRDDPEDALARADRALRRGGEDPVLRFLAGAALLELDRPHEAREQLSGAIELDPDDPELRSELALCLYRCCRFEEAATHARAALEADASFPDAHAIHALLLERQGRFDQADRELVRAAELDPQGFSPPSRMTREAFEQRVRAAGERLPEEFRRHLQQVAVTVEPIPSEEILLAEQPPLEPELLGLFVGVPLSERTHFSPGGELPPRICLFQRNLERYAPEPADLEEQIAVTLYHELGHYLGLDEEQLAEIKLA